MSTVTASELAHRTRRHGVRISERIAVGFLRDWQAQGIAEEIDGRWRLTRTGRAMFGGYLAAADYDQEAVGG
jgi:hypothetical protein